MFCPVREHTATRRAATATEILIPCMLDLVAAGPGVAPNARKCGLLWKSVVYDNDESKIRPPGPARAQNARVRYGQRSAKKNVACCDSFVIVCHVILS
eukprot:230256-Prymnesium_polylepis.1